MLELVLEELLSLPLSSWDELELDLLSLLLETMLWAPIIPGRIWILMLLPFLLSDFLVRLDLDLLIFPKGDERKVVLDFTALPKLLFESPPTFIMDGSMWGTFWLESIFELFLLFLVFSLLRRGMLLKGYPPRLNPLKNPFFIPKFG
jgi:hypothetical protein